MKKYLLVVGVLGVLGACTTSDVYVKTDVGGPNNVGSSFVEEEQKASDYCGYLFGVYKMSSDCSPDKIAKDNGLKTITEVNTQRQMFPFVSIQRTTVSGIK